MLEKRLLLIDFVASTATGHSAKKALERKDKKSLPIPVRLNDSINIYVNLLNLLSSFAAGDTVQQRSISLISAQLQNLILLISALFHVHRQSDFLLFI